MNHDFILLSRKSSVFPNYLTGIGRFVASIDLDLPFMRFGVGQVDQCVVVESLQDLLVAPDTDLAGVRALRNAVVSRAVQT